METKEQKEKLILPVRKDKTTNQKRVTIPKESTVGEKGYVEVADHE